MIVLMKNAFHRETETKAALAEFILNSKQLSMGVNCLEFEQEFAKYQGSKYGVLFNSGGSANLAMIQTMRNLGYLNNGDNIGFSALTWSTNVMPIIQLNMNPIPIDCELSTLNATSRQLLERLSEVDIKAFFITNALGLAGDLDKIRDICSERNIWLLEDNCEALGTELGGIKTGRFGIMGSFSFFVAHHMSTIEGGMVCTDSEELYNMLKIVRANGWDRNLDSTNQNRLRKESNINSEFTAKYAFYDLAYNLRPTEITGFLGRFQLKFLDANVKVREKNFLELEEALNNNPDLIKLDHKHIDVLSSFAFPVICRSKELRNFYIEKFNSAGVEIRPVIAGNIQTQPFYKKYINKQYALMGAEFIHDCGFYFGNYPELDDFDKRLLADCLRERSK